MTDPIGSMPQTAAVPAVPAKADDVSEAEMRDELERIDAVIKAVQYRHHLMEAVIILPGQSAAEAHLVTTTALTSAQVALLMNVSFGDLTRDARDAMYLRREELKRLLSRRR